ncbi:ABC transporter substrate-binding protein [Geminicoccaceae bacterium 1502E]|nr:ABC transporter substrate-binding protein [Geminicoccaceae bacterium 1502E]
MRPARLLGSLLMAATMLCSPAGASAAEPEGGKLRVAILADVNSFDPQSFLTVNFPVIKNFYDSLIEYTPEGEAVPSLATSWEIGPENRSVTVTLRDDVKFHSGAPLDARAVAATLEKAADPQRGKNVFATMSFVDGWEIVDERTIRLNFKASAPDRQITDLLQFLSVIDPAAMDSVDTSPAGTGAYLLAERKVGQEIRLKANPDYWRDSQPATEEVVLTIFSEDAAASAALESGAVDLVYGGTARSAVRLKDAGYQLVRGPGPLVQVFRINSTQGPFRNEKFRQAFNHLMPRAGILKVGYGGLGQVTALPWAPASPAADPSYNEKYAFDLDKARELLDASGLSAAEMSDWKLLVNGGDESLVTISQVAQGTLAKAGIDVELDIREGAEFVDAMLNGKFAAVFAAIGNIQKFPTRVATNSIYRTQNNPVFGEPHPHPAYVEAIARVNNTFSPDEVRAAYDHLNQVLVESAFAIPTNTYDIGLIVASEKVGGFTLDIDNMLVARTIGFAD